MGDLQNLTIGGLFAMGILAAIAILTTVPTDSALIPPTLQYQENNGTQICELVPKNAIYADHTIAYYLFKFPPNASGTRQARFSSYEPEGNFEVQNFTWHRVVGLQNVTLTRQIDVEVEHHREVARLAINEIDGSEYTVLENETYYTQETRDEEYTMLNITWEIPRTATLNYGDTYVLELNVSSKTGAIPSGEVCAQVGLYGVCG